MGFTEIVFPEEMRWYQGAPNPQSPAMSHYLMCYARAFLPKVGMDSRQLDVVVSVWAKYKSFHNDVDLVRTVEGVQRAIWFTLKEASTHIWPAQLQAGLPELSGLVLY